MRTPADHAERALLGVLLAQPQQTDELRRWLRDGDFYSPWHAATYRALQQLTTNGDSPCPQDVAAQLARDRHVRLPRPQDTNMLIVDLLYAAGRTDLASSSYGRMVLEASIHRAVHRHATGLSQIGEMTVDPDRRAELIDERVAAATEDLTGLGGRWTAAAGAVVASVESAGGNGGPPPSALTSCREAPAEDRLLGALIRRPGQLDRIRGWLQPDDFRSPARRDLYCALCDVADRGTPIEAVTVMWAAQTAGLLHHGGLTAEDVLGLAEAAPPGDPVLYARDVLADSIRAHTVSGAAGLRALARRVDLDPADLLAQSDRRLHDVADNAARLERSARPLQVVAR